MDNHFNGINGEQLKLPKDFSNSEATFQVFPSHLMEGLSKQQSSGQDSFLIEELTNLLFAEEKDNFTFGHDLYALNIMVGIQ